ncbi:HD domain-containing protein [Vibrio breoganii]
MVKNRYCVDLSSVNDTRRLVRSLFLDNDLVNRYKHTVSVASEMARLAKDLGLCPETAEILGLMHDVGYVECLAKTGFHPLDGYNFIVNFDRTLAKRMLMHTSCAEEAALKGIDLPSSIDDDYSKLLSYVDSRIDHLGRKVGFSQRLDSILERYGSSSLIGQANLAAWIRLAENNDYIERKLSLI